VSVAMNFMSTTIRGRAKSVDVRFTRRTSVTVETEGLQEYLRRNIVVASAVGAKASAEKSLARIQSWTHVSRRKWLEDNLTGEIERLDKVIPVLVAHRDELKSFTEGLNK